jgi:hypothetical protein
MFDSRFHPPPAKTKSASYGTALQNKDIQKVDLSNHYNAMIHHQKADATGLASALMRGITPWTSAILIIFRG